MGRKWGFALTLTAVIMIVFGPGPAVATPDYAGKWVRTAKYVDGTLANNVPATLILTVTSFSKIVPAPPAEACGFTGLMTVSGGHMRVTIQVSSCPQRVAPGAMLDHAYAVTGAGATLTTTVTTSEGLVKEVYKKDTEDSNVPGAGGCTHPLCGTWNRTATYVDGALMNTEPAYTIFTQKTYYSTTAMCYNALTLDSVEAASFTMTMIGHNCPTMPGVMGPGTVVVQTYELRDGGQTLVVTNTQYGAAVTTEFKRLE